MRRLFLSIICLLFVGFAMAQQRGIKLAQIIAADTSGYVILTDTAGFQQYVLADSLPSNFQCEELDSCSIFSIGDVDSTGNMNGYVLIWNDVTQQYEPGPLPADQTLSTNDNMDGTVDISITNGNTIQVDICGVVASNCNAVLTIIQDSIIQFTDNGGTVFQDTINLNAAETVTSLTVDYGIQELTYTNEAGIPVVVDVCRLVDSCESVTELILQNFFPFLLIYIDENGDSTQLDICSNVDSCETVTTFTVLQDTILAYTDEDGNTSFDTLDLSFLAESITTLVTDYNNQTLTYTNEAMSIEVVDVCRLVDSCVTFMETLTEISIFNDTVLQYVDENLDTTRLQLCPVVDSCETVTVLQTVQDTFINYTDEDGVTIQINVCDILDSCGLLPPAFGLLMVDEDDCMNGIVSKSPIDKINVGNGLFLDLDEDPNTIDLYLGGTSNQATCINTYDSGGDWLWEVKDTFVATLGPTAGTYDIDITNKTFVVSPLTQLWGWHFFVNDGAGNVAFSGAGHDNAKGPNYSMLATDGSTSSTFQGFFDSNVMRTRQGATESFISTELTSATINSDASIILETPEQQAGNTTAGMVFTAELPTGSGEWMDPQLRLANDSLFFDIGVINIDTVEFGPMVDAYETVTTLVGASTGPGNGTLTYTDEDLNPTVIDLCALIDSCTTPPKFDLLEDSILSFNDGWGTITKDTIPFGTLVPANETTTTFSVVNDTILQYVNEDDVTVSVDMCPIVDSCETNILLISDAGSGTYGIINEAGDTLLFRYNLATTGGGGLYLTDLAGNPAGAPIDICTVASQGACPTFSVFDGVTNDTITFGDTLNVIAGPGIQIDVADDTITFTATLATAQGICDSVAANCNATLVVSEDSILTFTDNAGNITIDTIRIAGDGWGTETFDITDGVTTTTIDPTDQINFADNANINVVVSGLVVSHFWIGGIAAMNDVDTTGQQSGDVLVFNGSTYVPQAGVVLNAAQICDSVAAECNTAFAADYVNKELDFTDNAGATFSVDICEFVDSCETVTTLTFSNPNLVFTDEDGDVNNVNISGIDTDVSSFSIVADTVTLVEDASTYKIANIDIAPFQTVTDGNTFNFTLSAAGNLTGEVLISADANNIITTGTDNALFAEEFVTSLSPDYPNSELDFTDEDNITTSIDICEFVDSCEYVTAISFYQDTLLQFIDEDLDTTRLNMCAVVDSCETVTTLVSQNDTTLVYTDEAGDATTIDLCASYDSCMIRRTAALYLTLKDTQTVVGSTDTVLFDSILVESAYAFGGGFIDTVGNTSGEYTLSNGLYMVQVTMLPVAGVTATMTYNVRGGASGATDYRPTVQSVEGAGTDGFTSPLNVMVDATASDQKVSVVISAVTGSPRINPSRTTMSIHRIGL